MLSRLRKKTPITSRDISKKDMQIIRFTVGDRLILKKKHPCGAVAFSVMRVGSDVRIVCTGCGRDLTIPRLSLEKMIKRVDAEKSGDN